MADQEVDRSFAAFFGEWAYTRGWDVPDVHWDAVTWLEDRGPLAVLRCFRGFGKSTLLAIYNAWCYWRDPSYRILHQGDQDRTAYKTARDTRHVLQHHPFTRGCAELLLRGSESFWWVSGSTDERNPSMQAAGITSNITSSRCDEAQNDDVEVPRNITNPEARAKMRYRLGEQTHCMVPGARQLFIGTPHTHDSLYDEMERMGADCLTIRMFKHERRFEDVKPGRHAVGFRPELVLAGIHAGTALLVEGEDYVLRDGGTVIEFLRPRDGIVDCYAGCAWPQRFTSAEMVSRRRKCKTVNEWDSQYQLHSRPLHEVRLDPARFRRYEVEPVLRHANRETALWLGRARIVSAACRWDPAGGKVGSDVSALAVVLSDEFGNRYWHRAVALEGEVAEFAADGKTITGGQVHRIAQVVKSLAIRRVTVENNGVGTFAPAILKAALKQARVHDCGVAEEPSTTNKNRTILEAFEGPLGSGKLWAHASVLDGPVWAQMRDWNPAVKSQPDDFLDAGAKALAETPERIGRIAPPADARWIPRGQERDDWRPSAGVFEVELED